MADRLISADALQEWIKNYLSVFKKYDWRDILQIIRKQPVVDAVPVVRCKDCKWFDRDDGSVIGDCEQHDRFTNINNFCAWGERREGDAVSVED